MAKSKTNTNTNSAVNTNALANTNATAGIMRNFISVPCDMYFTMERKIKSFLETTMLVYEVPREKIEEAKNFVSLFDWNTIAREAVENMLNYLESKI